MRLKYIQKIYAPIQFELEREDREGQLVSIVMPIHNQENKIAKIIESVSANLTNPTEFIILDDYSSDNSYINAKKALVNIFQNNYLISKVTILKSKLPLFETLSDAILFELANSEFIIEIQADMEIVERGFDSKLIRFLSKDPELALISGRGIHKIEKIRKLYLNSIGACDGLSDKLFKHLLKVFLILLRNLLPSTMRDKIFKTNNSQKIKFSGVALPGIYPSYDDFHGLAGRLDQAINYAVPNEILSKELIYYGETVMRGPLAIRKIQYSLVGGLDFKSFFQGFDDHDLCVRIRKLGFKVAYVPIGFLSPYEEGTGRAKKKTLGLLFYAFHACRIQFFRKKSSLYKEILLP